VYWVPGPPSPDPVYCPFCGAPPCDFENAGEGALPGVVPPLPFHPARLQRRAMPWSVVVELALVALGLVGFVFGLVDATGSQRVLGPWGGMWLQLGGLLPAILVGAWIVLKPTILTWVGRGAVSSGVDNGPRFQVPPLLRRRWRVLRLVMSVWYYGGLLIAVDTLFSRRPWFAPSAAGCCVFGGVWLAGLILIWALGRALTRRIPTVMAAQGSAVPRARAEAGEPRGPFSSLPIEVTPIDDIRQATDEPPGPSDRFQPRA
jgi:hypothetical protein